MLKVKEHLRRVAWRRVFCITQVVLAVALLEVGRAQVQVDDAIEILKVSQVLNPNVPNSREVEFPLASKWDYPPPLAHLLLFLIDCPAVIVTVPFGIFDTKLPILGIIGLVVFLSLTGVFWFRVGRRWDRRLGSIPRPPPMIPSEPQKSAYGVGLIICAAFSAFLIYSLVFTHFLFFWWKVRAGTLTLWSVIGTVYLWRKRFGSLPAGKKNA